LQGRSLPRHIGVLVDGNRRWARQFGYVDVNDGHRAGARKVEEVVGWCDRAGIKVATFYLLSTDNLKRPTTQLQPLLEIIVRLAAKLASPDHSCRLRVIGQLEELPSSIAKALSAAAAQTSGRVGGIEGNLLIGYNGRHEITEAVRAMLAQCSGGGITIGDLVDRLKKQDIADHLPTSGQPDPDFIFRTGGEYRLSGFLPWQSLDSELYFVDVNWPMFRHLDFLGALRAYAARDRRYGR
jgi:short-chain Z-isoprenyl diphosphate synthase